MGPFFEKNIKVLKKVQPSLAEKILNFFASSSIGEIKFTEKGHPLLKLPHDSGPVYLDGHNDPWESASIFLKKVPPGNDGIVVFIGFGMGYGPLRLWRERPSLSQIVIIEPTLDIFSAAIHYMDLAEFIEDEKVTFFVGEFDEKRFEEVVHRNAQLRDIHLLHVRPLFKWNHELYDRLSKKTYEILNQLSAAGATVAKKGHESTENIYRNLELLPYGSLVNELEKKFCNIPAIIVGAGPSLERDLDVLKGLKDKAIIISVDSALPVLLNNGIEPHFVTTIDMQRFDVEKINCVFGKRTTFSLIAILKCGYLLPRFFRPFRIFWAITEDASIAWLAELLRVKRFVPASTSVSHLALSAAIIMGADPIVLLGQDLCYPDAKGLDHAKGTVIAGSGIRKWVELLQRPGLNNQIVLTNRTFLSIKTQFENIIQTTSARVINATSQGLLIEGTENIRLEEVVQKFIEPNAVNATEIVKGELKNVPLISKEKIIDKLLSFQACLKRVRKTIGEILKTEGRVIRQLEALPATHRYRSLDSLPQKLRKQIHNFDKMIRQIEKEQFLWRSLIELTYGALKENDDWQALNKKILNKEGYVPWLMSEIRRMAVVQRKRLDAMEFFERHLVRSIEFYEKSINLTKHNDIIGLGLLYAKNYHLGLLSDLTGRYSDLKWENFFSGFIHAVIGNGKKALNLWKDIPTKVDIDTYKQMAMEPWFEFLSAKWTAPNNKEYVLGCYGAHLVSGWLKRIMSLAGNERTVRERLREIWPLHRKQIIALEKDGELEVAYGLVAAWDVCDFYLEGRNLLKAKLLYELGHFDQALEMVNDKVIKEERGGESFAFAARLLIEAGDFQRGIEWLTRAQKEDKRHALLWKEIYELALNLNDKEGALLSLQHYLKAFPEDVEALRSLGELYLSFGLEEDARNVLQEAVRLARKQSQKGHEKKTIHTGEEHTTKEIISAEDLGQYKALFKKGLDLQNKGHHIEAINIYEQALKIADIDPNLWLNLGVAYHKCSQTDKAEAALKRAVSLAPPNPSAQYNLGVLYLENKDTARAKKQFEEVLRHEPNHLGALNNLGHILLEIEQAPEKAIIYFNKLIKSGRSDAKTFYNIATCQWRLKQVEESISNFKKAISLDPGFVEAHWNLANVLLLKGELKEGFREYLWRWKRKEMIDPATLPVKYWKGEDVGGKKILVYAEQGAGDNIQFFRYINMLKKRGPYIIFACSKDLADLFGSVAEADEIILKDDMKYFYSSVDYHVPLLDLPTIYATDFESIPRCERYLTSPQSLVQRYGKLVNDDGIKIGFVWKGNPLHSNDRNRSVAFRYFDALFNIDGTRWYSLQYGVNELATNCENVRSMAPYLFNFAHTAAIIENLDLVITVDTSVAHLAGALGKEVWTLLPWLPDWRWGLEGETTPWYPTMRLIRQERPKDWDGVFARVRKLLEGRIAR